VAYRAAQERLAECLQQHLQQVMVDAELNLDTKV
jgi:hypothetical protein